MSLRRDWPGPVSIAAALAIGAACLLRALLLGISPFDPDEFEHLHGAWSLAHGQWPYRDYFEHHLPWLHLALAPMVAAFRVDQSPERAMALIAFARGSMWALSTLALVLTFALARLWAGTSVAWVATALLGLTASYVDRSNEIRPDVPALVCLLGSWLATLAALRRAPAPGTRWRLGVAGLLLGAAVMFTQKALFTAPATALLFLGWLRDPRAPGARPAKLAGVLLFAGGVALPLLATLVLFAPRSGVAAFLEFNFWLNARWPARHSPVHLMRVIAGQSPLLLGLAAVGLLRAGRSLLDRDRFQRGDPLFFLQAAGLLAGAFVLPSPYLQYYLMLLPLAAVLAARTLVDGVAALARAAGPAWLAPRRQAWLTAIALLAAGLTAALALVPSLHPPPAKRAEQLRRIRFVLAHTLPQDTVLDGFSGAGVFRPHAWFYFFLHDEIRALLGTSEIARLRGQLRDGEIAPALVVFDDDLRQLAPEITAFVQDNYEAVEDGVLLQPKALWLDGPPGQGRLDLGGGPTDVLVGRGWSSPEHEGGTTFRRTDARRATLRVPLRAPADLRLGLRARVEETDLPARVELSINGVSCGQQPLRAGWSEYDFQAPRGVWRAGINGLRLGLTAGDARTSSSAGLVPPALAVDYLQVAPSLGP